MKLFNLVKILLTTVKHETLYAISGLSKRPILQTGIDHRLASVLYRNVFGPRYEMRRVFAVGVGSPPQSGFLIASKTGRSRQSAKLLNWLIVIEHGRD